MAHWHYTTGAQPNERSAALDSMLPLDVAGNGNLKPARLVFRDDPVDRHKAMLELGSGQFYCPIGCQVQAQVDARAPLTLQASQPLQQPARLMFFDPRGLWYELSGGRLLKLRFKAKNWRRYTAMFQIDGLDRSWLDWDQELYARDYRKSRPYLSAEPAETQPEAHAPQTRR